MDRKKTIRLVLPQWQGGNHRLYSLGAKLMAWLVPESKCPQFEIKVPEYSAKTPEPENGMVYRGDICKQLEETMEVLDREQPDRVVTFGGDCLVSQAPFSWLNEKYKGEMGVLWVDAHPDIKTNKDWMNAHTYVLGNLLGEGDPELASMVKVKVSAERVMYAGLIEEGLTEQESEVINRLKLGNARPEVLAVSSDSVLQWIRDRNIRHLAVHLDLDVIHPDKLRSVLFAEPDPKFKWREMYPYGQLAFETVARLLKDVSAETDVVALTIAEHFPWDTSNLQDMFAAVPILNC